MNKHQIKPFFKKIESLKTLVIGDVMLDHYIYGKSTRLSPEAPVPVVNFESETYVAGGAAHVARSVAALGSKTTLIGLKYDDEAGKKLFQLLQTENIFNKLLISNTPTIVKTRIITDRQLLRLDREKSSPKEILFIENDLFCSLESEIPNTDIVIISDYNKGLITQDIFDFIRRLCIKYKKFLSINAKPQNKIDIYNVDLLTVNKKEALSLLNSEELNDSEKFNKELSYQLHTNHNAENVLVTLGENGMAFYNKMGYIKSSAIKTRVKSAVGAGDSAIAAMTLALKAGLSKKDCLDFANLVAGIAVGGLGTSVVTVNDIKNYYKI